MKVKIFSVSNPLGGKRKNQLVFESEINDWLSQNSGIEIIQVKQSASGGSVNAHVLGDFHLA